MGFDIESTNYYRRSTMNLQDDSKQSCAGPDHEHETVDATLAERGSRYGEFEYRAAIAQSLQAIMRDTNGWVKLEPHQAQALTVIADKIARILNGDPNYIDNWHDIQGYAKLVENILIKEHRTD